MKAIILVCGLAAAVLASTATAQDHELRAVSIWSSHSHWEPNKAITVVATIKSAGREVTNGAECGVYLSRDTTFSAGDKLLTTFPIKRIAPGRKYEHSLNIWVPFDIGAGRYHLILFADHKSKIKERNERDNTATHAITGVAKVDVRISTLRILSTKPTAGEEIRIEYRAKNHGGLSATVSTGFYLSTNRTISQSDYFVGSDTIGYLSPRATVRRVVTLKVPSHLRGAYYFAAMGDYAGRIPESLENNNVLAISTTIERTAATVRRLEFQPKRVTSAQFLHSMTVNGADGGNASMALTAPALARKPYLLVLSRKEQFVVDDLTLLGITYVNTSYFRAWMGTLNSAGNAFPSVVVRKGSGRATGYVHAFLGGFLEQTVEKPVKITVR